jgi:dTDP-4-dehydrorhamnose 3,5-epimerase
MKVSTTVLDGVLLFELEAYSDARGSFTELFVQKRYAEAGMTQLFVQDNWSVSGKGVLRGLHFQKQHPQGKLVTVCQGHILDVVADVDPDSATFGQYIAVNLHGMQEVGRGRNKEIGMQQLWIPPGYAHGFCVLSDQASVLYKCTQIYHPEDEAGVVWHDADLAIDWPLSSPVVSEKDKALPTLQQWAEQCARVNRNEV